MATPPFRRRSRLVDQAIRSEGRNPTTLKSRDETYTFEGLYLREGRAAVQWYTIPLGHVRCGGTDRGRSSPRRTLGNGGAEAAVDTAQYDPDPHTRWWQHWVPVLDGSMYSLQLARLYVTEKPYVCQRCNDSAAAAASARIFDSHRRKCLLPLRDIIVVDHTTQRRITRNSGTRFLAPYYT